MNSAFSSKKSIPKPTAAQIKILKQKACSSTALSKSDGRQYSQKSSKIVKMSKPYVNVSVGTNKRNTGCGFGTFDRAYSSVNVKTTNQDKQIVQKVQKNLKHLTKNRGKHDKWSLLDVPIKLLRKPTNFNFLYNSNAMANFYNHKAAVDELAQRRNTANKVNSSFEEVRDLKSALCRSSRKFGTIEPDKAVNRSLNLKDSPDTMKIEF